MSTLTADPGTRCPALAAIDQEVVEPHDVTCRGRILAVDDDDVLRVTLARSLHRLGYQVATAEDGAGALAAADEDPPDVILLDVGLPGMDGYEVCRRLKAKAATRLIPVVFLTGRGTAEARMEGLEAGAADFINKPCNLAELEVRMRNLVQFRRLVEDLDSAEEIVFSIARAVEARDEGTGDHCERLAELSVRLGRHLGLGPEACTALRRAGYLHDIGKLGVPDAVLLKPGPLNDDERAIMRRHVEVGYDICVPLRTLRPALPIIRHHHEKGDGSGYPDGLAGKDIPYLARVFQVVDVFDALANDRCYRKAFPLAEALAIIREESERGWWDPEVVAAFCTMMEGESAPR